MKTRLIRMKHFARSFDRFRKTRDDTWGWVDRSFGGTFLPPKVGKTTPVKIEKIRLFLFLRAYKSRRRDLHGKTILKVLQQVQEDWRLNL